MIDKIQIVQLLYTSIVKTHVYNMLDTLISVFKNNYLKKIQMSVCDIKIQMLI